MKYNVFCADPVATKQIILRELLNLNSTSNVVEICNAKKIENIKILYLKIPRDSKWF